MSNKKIKIIFTLILSFFLTRTISNIFFVNQSPLINYNFLANFKIVFNNKLKSFINQKKITKNSPTPFPQLNENNGLVFNFEKKYLVPTKLLPSPTIKLEIQPTLIKSFYPSVSPTSSFIKIETPSPIQFSNTLSSSKLGIFILNNYSSGAEKILNSGPRIIKFLDPQYQSIFIEAVKKYKQNYPYGVTVIRFWNGTSEIKYQLNNDPIQSADDFFNRVNKPAFEALGSNISYFDYLQTPNEFENTPEWWGKDKVSWNGKFWRHLTELNKNFGIKTCIGGIPVDNLEASDLGYIIDDLRAMKNLGAAFCYHSYTYEYSTDINTEIRLSLRYRQFYQFFQNNAPDLVNMPLILSEGGVAEGGNPKAGYLKSQSVERYKNWLLWFDNELKKDSYVIGVTLFQIGNNTDWGYFNLEPIADWLAEYLRK